MGLLSRTLVTFAAQPSSLLQFFPAPSSSSDPQATKFTWRCLTFRSFLDLCFSPPPPFFLALSGSCLHEIHHSRAHLLCSQQPSFLFHPAISKVDFSETSVSRDAFLSQAHSLAHFRHWDRWYNCELSWAILNCLKSFWGCITSSFSWGSLSSHFPLSFSFF